MIGNLLYYLGAAAIGGLVAFGIGSLISKYIKKAKEWFNRLWHGLSRIYRAVGILIRQGNRLFKRFIAQFSNGEVQQYYDENDEGVEIEWNKLSSEAQRALAQDDFITVENYA